MTLAAGGSLKKGPPPAAAFLWFLALLSPANAAPLPPRVPEPASGGAPQHTVVLDIPAESYFATDVGRGLLKYLVRCAFDANILARLELPSETVSYPGGLGLAPAWADRPLSLAEQRWVSACILSLANKFGNSVKVDLRGDHPRLNQDSAEELRSFPLHEGGFFGNLFVTPPVAYVCQGRDISKIGAAPIGSLRVCAQSPSEIAAEGKAVNQCGFVATGPCGSTSSLTVDGEKFEEVIHVWLPLDPIK